VLHELPIASIGMHACPYCGAGLHGENRACAACGRDVDLLRKLQQENNRLRAELKAKGDDVKLKPPVQPRDFVWRLSSRYLVAVALLLIADLLIQFAFDARRSVLLAVSFLIPVVIGYSMGIRASSAREFMWAIATAPVAAAAAVVVLGLPLWVLRESSSVLPQGGREWREAIQFCITTTFALATGLGLARAVRSHVDESPGLMEDWLREWFLPEHFDGMPHDVRAERFKRLLTLVATATSALVSLAPVLLRQLA
jgi:hypothetical protein